MASFSDAQPDPKVTSVPYFASGTVADGATTTISFDNVTERINVVCTNVADGGTDALLVGVTTTGVTTTARIALTSGQQTGWFDCKTTKVVVRGGGSVCSWQLIAVLGREDASAYPTLTAAAGFSGVE
jgi:hypothetical protein